MPIKTEHTKDLWCKDTHSLCILCTWFWRVMKWRWVTRTIWLWKGFSQAEKDSFVLLGSDELSLGCGCDDVMTKTNAIALIRHTITFCIVPVHLCTAKNSIKPNTMYTVSMCVKHKKKIRWIYIFILTTSCLYTVYSHVRVNSFTPYKQIYNSLSGPWSTTFCGSPAEWQHTPGRAVLHHQR